MECPICCHAAVKESVTCPQCDQSVCVSCAVKFIEVNQGELSCMMCKVPWTSQFAYTSIPAARWTKAMKEQRKLFLDQQSRAELLEVQEAIPTLRRIQDNVHAIREKRAQLKRLKDELAELEVQKTQDLFEVNTLLHHGQDRSETSAAARVRREVPLHCPREGCRGFLQDNACPVCSVRVCAKCKCEKQGEDHACDPTVLQNLAEMQRSTRPCPNCHAPSQKINGCSQVFCYACKRSWMWDTGRLVALGDWQHSPDYYDYIRKTQGTVPRAPGDHPGLAHDFDDNPGTHRYNLINALRDSTFIVGPDSDAGGSGFSSNHNFMGRGRSGTNQLSSVGKFLMMADQEIGEYQDRQHHFLYGLRRQRLVQATELLKDVRIRFLMGDITEKQWQKELSRREKQAALVHEEEQLHTAMRQAFQTCARTVSMARHPYREDVMKQGVKDFARACQVLDKEYSRLYATFGSAKTSPMTQLVESIPAGYHQ